KLFYSFNIHMRRIISTLISLNIYFLNSKERVDYLIKSLLNKYFCKVKRILAIFFLFTFLNANTAFGEVLKLPVLIHHYIEHSREDKDAAVFHFLVQHYSGNISHQHQGNHNDHEKLPFKTTDGHFSSLVSIVFPPFTVTSHNTIVTADLKIPVYSQHNYSNAYLNSIWQPPRCN